MAEILSVDNKVILKQYIPEGDRTVVDLVYLLTIVNNSTVPIVNLVPVISIQSVLELIEGLECIQVYSSDLIPGPLTAVPSFKPAVKPADHATCGPTFLLPGQAGAIYTMVSFKFRTCDVKNFQFLNPTSVTGNTQLYQYRAVTIFAPGDLVTYSAT